MKTCAKQIKKVLALVCALAVSVSAFSGLSVFAIDTETNGLIASNGFEVGKLIAKLDPTNSLTEGWTLHSNSSIVASPENDGTKTVRLDNTNGDHNYADVATNFVADDFVVEVVIGSDSNSSKADGNPYIAINDTDADGNIISTERFGFAHKNRVKTNPSAGKYFYVKQGDSKYYQPSDVVFEDDGYTQITLTVYRVDGSYYYYANGELICEYTTVGEQTGNITLNIADSYSFAYVHSAEVYEIVTEEPEGNNGLVEESGFEVGELITRLDPTNSLTEGWTLHSYSSIVASPENDGTKTVRLDNATGDHNYADVATTFNSDNFVVVAVIGSDSNSSKADGNPYIAIKDTDADGNVVSTERFGFAHKNRTKYDPSSGKYFYRKQGDSKCYQPSDVSFDDDGYTQITLTVYRYNGTYYYYANGTLICEYATVGEQTGNITLNIADSYSFAYVHSASVYEIKRSINEPAPEDSGLYEASGFITGDVIEQLDFSSMSTGSITEIGNWSFTKASITTAPDGSGNALRLNDNYAKASATVPISKNNFVAVAVFGTNSNDTSADGAPSLSITGLNESGEIAHAVGVAFAQKNRGADRNPSNGGTMVTDGFYNYKDKIEFDDDGYTLVTVTIYAYNDVFYCYCQDMFLGEYANCTGVSTEEYREVVVSDSFSNVYVHNVKVYDIIPADFTVDGAVYRDNGLEVTLTLDQSKNGDFDMSEAQYGAVVTLKDGSTPDYTTVETEGTALASFTATNDSIVKFNHFVAADTNKYVNVRPYIYANDTYYYSEPKILSVKALSAVAKGENTKKITFTAFSDFHYMKNQETGIICRSGVSDLISILNRAEETNSAFVMHCGDFIKDAKVSSEIFEAYHNYKKENGEIMPVYGIYGNHDIEQGNAMTTVNPTLTNDENTVWGTPSGKMEVDSRIAYYYSDYDNFRFIYLDDMYSFNPSTQEWERNRDGSYSYPSGNTMGYSLGPVQMAWLENVLTDAGQNDMTCVIATHAGKHDKLAGATGGDRYELLELLKSINNAYPSTVVLALSGHTHSNEIVESDGIVWMTVHNTFANLNTGDSIAPQSGIYSEDMTVRKEIYDNNGNFLRFEDVPLNTFQFTDQTYFCEDPLSAVITISENGDVFINGNESEWAYGIEPAEDCLKGLSYERRGVFTPYISDYSTVNCELVGHIFNESDECSCCGKYVFKETYGVDYEYIKIAESVVDNETYSVKIKYNATSDKDISFLTADNDYITINNGYVGCENKKIITLHASKDTAEAFITVDKNGGKYSAQGDALYLYLEDSNGLVIESVTITKLTDNHGGALLSNKGVSILEDVPENVSQAMRFYFSYDTNDGSDIIINGTSYKLKSRGFLLTNGNTYAEELITRDTVKTNSNVIDINVTDFNKCWKTTENYDGTDNVWFSAYVTGFEAIDGTYNNAKALYVKGYVVFEADGVEYTLYSGESNYTVSQVATLVQP